MCVNSASNFLCKIKIILACLPAVLVFLCFSNNIFAVVMTSGNYRIEADDSLTPGGGNSASANYIFRDTMGEVSTGSSDSNSGSYKMKAGYQEMLETYLTVSSPGPVAMSPDIPGVSGGTATNGTGTAWYVITDNFAGFSMKINALNSPHALVLDGDPTHYFDNYTTDGTPTYGWSVASAAKFGYAVVPGGQGGLAVAFKDNGPSVCGSGSGSGNCWAGFLTTPVNIISTSARTNVSPGEQETVDFKAQSNNTVLESGTYKATIVTTVSLN
jgi:hypothetical protein